MTDHTSNVHRWSDERLNDQHIRIVIPTVPGREDSLNRAVRSYLGPTTGALNVSVDVRRGYKACGEAWDDGALAFAEELGVPNGTDPASAIVVCSNDDIEAADPAWATWVRYCIHARGRMPSPLIYSHGARLETCGGTWHAMTPDLEPAPVSLLPAYALSWWLEGDWSTHGTHYFSDNILSEYAHRDDHGPLTLHGYRVNHWWEQAERKDTKGPEWDEAKALHADLRARFQAETGRTW